ncbi:hypothetical protein RHMOL_Rhmol07G0313500 [Rhododendron molle]|uniref:Uncharacterized protein n=1 Tax=Rhododendron molle TaxID=49168 RepID=A0ACC0N8H0_RHOML|nr:hypothetical protein RHMOL_Rhmol07G0313500 [Rhododendron molle]
MLATFASGRVAKLWSMPQVKKVWSSRVLSLSRHYLVNEGRVTSLDIAGGSFKSQISVADPQLVELCLDDGKTSFPREPSSFLGILIKHLHYTTQLKENEICAISDSTKRPGTLLAESGMQRKRKCEEPSIPSEEDGTVESRFRERGMKLVKKAGIRTADRRTEGQPRGNARNKRNFNGHPTASRNTQM